MENKHEKALKKDFLYPPYLDKFDLKKYNLPNVSAIVPTFNRSPHPVLEDSNPLGWCLESILAQQSGNIDEIVVIDDASEDYTEQVVEHVSSISDIPFVYVKNKKNCGSPYSKNMGVENSKNEHILFLDDDCIISPYLFFGANYTLNSLDEDVAALHLPIYHRKVTPEPISKNRIGELDLERGVMEGNFGGFPTEYSSSLEENFLDKKLKIFNPFEIKNLGGIFLTKKTEFKEAGGFPNFLTWSNGYREETNLSIGLSDKGYKIFFTPDPKFHCIHLKYGAYGIENKENLDPKLKRLVSKSNMQYSNTGNRVEPEEWFFNRIISTYVTIGRKDFDAAQNYLDKIYHNFVEQNNFSMTGVETKISDSNKRESIFQKAVEEGNKLISTSA